MTDNQLRMLTEYCEECWHEIGVVSDYTDYWGRDSRAFIYCKFCKKDISFIKNRTFTTPTDAHLLAQCISRKGEWLSFEGYIFKNVYEPYRRAHVVWFTEWLMTLPAEEFCLMVCKWKGWE